jgi:hypothetical protein
MCCQVIRTDSFPTFKTKFHQNLWASYKEGFTGECTLKVSSNEFKVINVKTYFKVYFRYQKLF